jgi:hypothetical protein
MSVLRPLLIVLLLLNLLALATGQGWLGTAGRQGEPERLTNQISPELIVLLAADPAVSAAQPSSALSTRTPPIVPAPPPIAPAPPPLAPAPPPLAPAPPGPPAATTRPSAAPPPSAGDAPDTPVFAAAEHPAGALASASPPDHVADTARACVAYAGITVRQAERIEQAARSAGSALDVERETIEAPSGWWVRLPPAESLQAAERRARELRALGVSDLFIIREAGPNQFAISLGLFGTESRARQHLADLESRRVRGAEITVRNPGVLRIEVSGPAARVRSVVDRVANELPALAGGDCMR